MRNGFGHKAEGEVKTVFAGMLILVVLLSFCPVTAYGGVWRKNLNRPENEAGTTNRQWLENDGTIPAGRWAWIDGNGDGLAECYYFNSEGYLLTAPAMPEGYTVSSTGAWTKNGIVQAFPNEWVPGGRVYTADVQYRSTTEMSSRINPLQTEVTAENATHSTMTDEEAYAILMQIKAEYPEGTAWDSSELYVSGSRYGYGCGAFVFMIQDRLYGAAARPMRESSLEFDSLRVGDHIRVENNTHSIIVLSRGDGYITAAEANYNGTVHWERQITEEELRSQFVYRETCY